MSDSPNYIAYPFMVRNREDEIQQGEVARAEDVAAELDNVAGTYNQLVGLLQGEWGGTGRIYELVDNAVLTANAAKQQADMAVLRTGDTMEGHLNQPLSPISNYNLVNKEYVDTKVATGIAPGESRITTLENKLDNLKATSVGFTSNDFTNVTEVDAALRFLWGKHLLNVSDIGGLRQDITGINTTLGTLNAQQILLNNQDFVSSTVHGGMSELFQYVSSGKGLVAAAITDQGVPTSSAATFLTMSENIRSIQGGGGGGIPTGGTALSSDIRYGKTAYSGGEYIMGSLLDPDIIEVTMGDLTAYVKQSLNVSNIGISLVNPQTYAVDTTGTNILTHIHDFGTDYIYLLWVDPETGDVSYNPDKHRYSAAELGIGESEEIKEIRLGAVGFNNTGANLCIIRTDTKYHIYGYRRGVTTSEFVKDSSNNIIHMSLTTDGVLGIFNLNPHMFYKMNGVTLELYKINPGNKTVSRTQQVRVGGFWEFWDPNTRSVQTSSNDKIIYIDVGLSGSNTNAPGAVAVDTSDISLYVAKKSPDWQKPGRPYNSQYNSSGGISADGQYMIAGSGATTIGSLKYYKVNVDEAGSVTYTELTTIMSNVSMSDKAVYFTNFGRSVFITTGAGTYLYSIDPETHAFTLVTTFTTARKQPYLIPWSNEFFYYVNTDGSLERLAKDWENETLVGVIYQGKMFYDVPGGTLTAVPGDVYLDKTFIGAKGTPERGQLVD